MGVGEGVPKWSIYLTGNTECYCFLCFCLCRLTGPLHVLLVHLYVLHEQKGSFRVIEGFFDTAWSSFISSLQHQKIHQPVQLPSAPRTKYVPWVTESDQRITGTWRRHITEVFSCFLFPEIQPFIKDLGTTAGKSAFTIFVWKERRKKRGEKKEKGWAGKREPAPPDASQLYGANEHKCHCHAEMKNKCITLAKWAEVGGQEDTFCIWRGTNTQDRDRDLEQTSMYIYSIPALKCWYFHLTLYVSFLPLQIRCCIRLRGAVLEQSLFPGRNVSLLLISGQIVEDD